MVRLRSFLWLRYRTLVCGSCAFLAPMSLWIDRLLFLDRVKHCSFDDRIYHDQVSLAKSSHSCTKLDWAFSVRQMHVLLVHPNLHFKTLLVDWDNQWSVSQNGHLVRFGHCLPILLDLMSFSRLPHDFYLCYYYWLMSTIEMKVKTTSYNKP